MALAQYDMRRNGGNNDKLITVDDAIWEDLLLWNDINADGVSTLNEVNPLSDTTIRKLQTKGRKTRKVDDAGNIFYLWARAKSG